MKTTLTCLLLAALAATCLPIFATSCGTVEEPSPHIKKFREDSDIGSIKPRQQRKRPN